MADGSPRPSSASGLTSPPSPAEAVAALARQLDRLQRLVEEADADGLRADVRGLTATVAGLADELADVVQAGAGREDPAPSWLCPTPFDSVQLARDTAALQLGQLVDWLRRVYLWFADSHLPECWLWHPAVVEELTWLWAAWRAAYQGPGASVQRAGDWYDRQRPGVVRRIRAAAGECSLREHLAPGRQPSVPTADAASAIAAWWADLTSPPPTPTSDQIQAADAAHSSRVSGSPR